MLCMYVRAVVFGCIFVTSTFAVNCPKGSYISSRGCTPCPENEYSDYVNSTKCWKCDACKGRHNLVTQVCNSTTNTKCACEPGFYWDDALFCLKCDRCKRGHGMVKNCTSDSNTVCEHCEHGKTYSDKKDFNSCKNCSICPDGYFEQRRCTRKNDTICLKDTEQNKSKNNWKIDNRGRSSGSRQRGGSKPRLKNKNSTQSPIQHSTNTSILKTIDGSSSLKSMEMITTGTEMELVIALGVVSGFAFLVLIVTLSLMFLMRRKSRKSTKDTDKERVEDPTPSASATEVARENPYTSLPHIGTGQGPGETGPPSRPTDESDCSQPHRQDAGSPTNRCLCSLFDGIPTSTRRSYQSAQRRYIAFCKAEGRTTPNGSPLPADERTLMHFCTRLVDNMNPYSSIKLHLSAVRSLHMDNGLCDPLLNCHQLEYLIKGIKQVEGSSSPRRLPVTIDLMRIIHQSLDFTFQDNVMLWAACCLGFFGFVRTGEFTVNESSFNAETHMTIRDIEADSEVNSSFLKVHIKRPKMEPFRKECDVYVGRGDTCMCPLEAIINYLEARGSTSGPLFLHLDGTPLTRQTLSSTLKSILDSAGFSSAHSGYSFRIGAAETAASRGVSGHLIRTLGRRSSRAYDDYSRTPVCSILRVTKQIL